MFALTVASFSNLLWSALKQKVYTVLESLMAVQASSYSTLKKESAIFNKSAILRGLYAQYGLSPDSSSQSSVTLCNALVTVWDGLMSYPLIEISCLALRGRCWPCRPEPTRGNATTLDPSWVFLFLASSSSPWPPPSPSTGVSISWDACRTGSRDSPFAWPGTYFVAAEGHWLLLGEPGVRVGGFSFS